MSSCSGLPAALTSEIIKYGGIGLTYTCTGCRLRPAGSTNVASLRQCVDQLHNTVQALAKTVADLVSWRQSFETPGPTPIASSPAPQQPDYSVLIREEIREMRERDKRKKCIIIKGIPFSNLAEFSGTFNQVTSSLIGQDIQITNVSCIRDEMVRAAINDDNVRVKLLTASPKLKNNRLFSNIYINKDLTHKQRTELMNRRLSNRQSSRGSSHVSGANALPVADSRTPVPVLETPCTPGMALSSSPTFRSEITVTPSQSARRSPPLHPSSPNGTPMAFNLGPTEN